MVSGPQAHSALVARSELMKEILRDDPGSARSYALDESVRAAIVAADPSAASLMEQEEAITGELVVLVADDFEGRTSRTLYTLHTFERDFDLSFAKAMPGMERMAHRQVTVRGLGLGSLLAAESLAMATPAEMEQCASERSAESRASRSPADTVPATCSTTGVQRIAVLMVTFPGNTPAFPAGMDQAAYWNSILFGPDPSVNGFWNEVSYGQTSATGDVFGPFALSKAYDCKSINDMATAAFAAATGTVNFNQYNRYVIVFPVDSCYFGGMASSLGCMGASLTVGHEYSYVWLPISSWYRPDDASPQMWGCTAHELGHSLGLGHANTLDFGSLSLGPLDYVATNPGTVQPAPPPAQDSAASTPAAVIAAVNTEYGDYSSVMGNAWGDAGPYSAEHRVNLLGWIPRSDEREVTASGTYTLVPAEDSSGLRALRVLRDPISGTWLWLEFHQPIGFYTPNNLLCCSNPTLTNGALVHYEDGSLDWFHTYLLDMTPNAVPNNFLDGTLAPGASWSDPYSLLTLTAGAQTSSSLPITVSYDAPCATLSLSASELSIAGGTANLTITAPSSCSWTVSSNASWISFPGATTGSGNATVPFAFTANTTAAQRNSYITAQRQSLPIVQDGPNLTIVGVSPAMSAGSSQSFVVQIHDSKGFSDVSYTYFELGGEQCWVTAINFGAPGDLNYYLALWGASTMVVPGSNQSISAGICTLYGSGSSVVYNGDQLVLTFNLSFSASSSGTYTLEVQAEGASSRTGTMPFGIFTVNATSLSATPVFSPAGGTLTSPQSVTITDATANAAIYYTTDGSGPTTSSTLYKGPITVSQPGTISALAIAPGYSQSLVATAAFTVAAPVLSPNGGTYTAPQTASVTVTDASPGATIYYTTDGTRPTTGSTRYTGPITVSKPEWILAIATAPGVPPSSVAQAYYGFYAAAPILSPNGGTFISPQTVPVTITDATPGATIYYTTDGSWPTTQSKTYSGPISVSSTEVLTAFAAATGYLWSKTATATYTFSPQAATPKFSPGAGTYTAAQSVTLSDATAGATILYTLDGSTPTASSTKYTGALTVSQTTTIKAIATASGYANSAVASATYTINLPAAATPVIMPAGGTYTAAQSVTMTDATKGAAIYYTTDGSAPSATNGTKYVGALAVKATETIKAIAVASGYGNSAVATAAYTLHVPQSILFAQPVSPVTYGVKPILLSATASSGLPVVLSVLSGPGTLNGNALTITGAGAVVIAANQTGSASYAAAAQVTRTITVSKANLTVKANNLSMKAGGTVPALTYAMSGFVNGDTQAKATTGAPKLTTAATSKSAAGSYPITVTAGTLAAGNYGFSYLNGTMTVTK